jgi:hypothetical protein
MPKKGKSKLGRTQYEILCRDVGHFLDKFPAPKKSLLIIFGIAAICMTREGAPWYGCLLVGGLACIFAFFNKRRKVGKP